MCYRRTTNLSRGLQKTDLCLMSDLETSSQIIVPNPSSLHRGKLRPKFTLSINGQTRVKIVLNFWLLVIHYGTATQHDLDILVSHRYLPPHILSSLSSQICSKSSGLWSAWRSEFRRELDNGLGVPWAPVELLELHWQLVFLIKMP